MVGIGLLPGLEARLGSILLRFSPLHEPSRGGLGDSLVGVKHRLLNETKTTPALMYAVTLRLPTGDAARGLGEQGVDTALIAVGGKTLGPVKLTWNGGYTFVSRDRALDFWLLTGALEYRPTQTWALVGECVSTLGVTKVPAEVVLRVGAVYPLSRRLKLDGALGWGVTRASPDLLLTVGVTIALF